MEVAVVGGQHAGICALPRALQRLGQQTTKPARRRAAWATCGAVRVVQAVQPLPTHARQAAVAAHAREHLAGRRRQQRTVRGHWAVWRQRRVAQWHVRHVRWRRLAAMRHVLCARMWRGRRRRHVPAGVWMVWRHSCRVRLVVLVVRRAAHAHPVHHLSYFLLVFVDVVAELRLLEAGGRHALVASARSRRRRVRRVEARLDQCFAGLGGNHRLQLARGERVDVTGLRGDQQHDLGPRQRR